MQSRNLQTPGANLLATTDPAREAPQVRVPCNNRGGCPSPSPPLPTSPHPKKNRDRMLANGVLPR